MDSTLTDFEQHRRHDRSSADFSAVLTPTLCHKLAGGTFICLAWSDGGAAAGTIFTSTGLSQGQSLVGSIKLGCDHLGHGNSGLHPDDAFTVCLR